MTCVAIAAGFNNELQSHDLAILRRLREAGYEVQLYYYLPRIPAEFSIIPSFNEELQEWKNHAKNMLERLALKLEITSKNRHFIDEILGPDKVFDEVKEADLKVILTSDKHALHQSALSKFYDYIAALFSKRKKEKIVIENISDYVTEQLGPLPEVKEMRKRSAIARRKIRRARLEKKRVE
jgi:hypothetical protein